MAFDVIDHKPEINSCEEGKKAASKYNVEGKIEFKNVGFRYPSRDDLHVLKYFSCVFEKGKTTAVVGPSGSGKSTIVSLIERFYDPSTG